MRFLLSTVRVSIAIVAIFALIWWFGVKMPGENIAAPMQLTPDEIALRQELRADVQKLAGEIGERNLSRYPQLRAAADFIEDSFARASEMK